MVVRFLPVLMAVLVLGLPARAFDPMDPAAGVQVWETTIPARGQRPRAVELRVSLPREGAGPWPVIVYSAGAFCELALNWRLLDGWAGAGYVVIAPRHLDSRDYGEPARDEEGRPQMALDIRAQDMRAVLDHAVTIEAALPAVRGKIDWERTAAAGHSLGALIALQMVGADAVDAATGEASPVHQDERFDAVLTYSAPGRLPGMDEASWQGITVPSFTATGTADVPLGSPPGWTAEWRRESWEFASPDADASLLWVEGLDHYMGGLVCREDVPGPRDRTALATFLQASTAFLDRVLKGEGAGADPGLIGGLSQGRAELLRRAHAVSRPD